MIYKSFKNDYKEIKNDRKWDNILINFLILFLIILTLFSILIIPFLLLESFNNEVIRNEKINPMLMDSVLLKSYEESPVFDLDINYEYSSKVDYSSNVVYFFYDDQGCFQLYDQKLYEKYLKVFRVYNDLVLEGGSNKHIILNYIINFVTSDNFLLNKNEGLLLYYPESAHNYLRNSDINLNTKIFINIKDENSFIIMLDNLYYESSGLSGRFKVTNLMRVEKENILKFINQFDLDEFESIKMQRSIIEFTSQKFINDYYILFFKIKCLAFYGVLFFF